MKHATLDQMTHVAAVHLEPPPNSPMSRSERLQRWAKLLDVAPERPLATLEGTEYQNPQTRQAMRSDHSPISVAFADPALRAEGLANDSYGEAKRFFELSDWQLHEIVCYCHFGGTVQADTAARRVRAAIGGNPKSGFISRLRQAFVG